MIGEADRAWDRALGIQTAGREDERGGRYMPYEPTPYAVLERLAASGWLRAEDRVLDVGCGKGRVAFFLADRVGCRVTGIDHSEKLIAMAEANRERFRHAPRVRFLRERAEVHAFGDEDALFFFNPFSEAVLRVLLRRLPAGKRRLIFYYSSEAFEACLSEHGLRRTGEADLRDLFDGDDPRERLMLYETAEADG